MCIVLVQIVKYSDKKTIWLLVKLIVIIIIITFQYSNSQSSFILGVVSADYLKNCTE